MLTFPIFPIQNRARAHSYSSALGSHIEQGAPTDAAVAGGTRNSGGSLTPGTWINLRRAHALYLFGSFAAAFQSGTLADLRNLRGHSGIRPPQHASNEIGANLVVKYQLDRRPTIQSRMRSEQELSRRFLGLPDA
jgi:hypothetical protein